MKLMVVLLLVTLAFLAGAAYFWRRTAFHLLGPVFFFDIVRLSRRSRFVLLRTGYAVSLLILLFLAYRESVQEFRKGKFDWFATSTASPEQMERLARSVFFAFMSAQFVAVFLLTPVYTSGAIAEEKDRRTLELLFACGLTSREIVLGKLVSRLMHVMALILAGVPIIALLPFWGGVDPNLVIAGFAATAMTAVSLGSLGLRLSISAARPLDAALATYGFAFSYMVISPCVPGLNAW